MRPPPPSVRFTAVFVAYAAAVGVGLMFRTEPEKFAVFWPPNGLLLGLLLVGRDRAATAAAAALAGFVVNLALGNTVPVAAGFTVVNVAEPWLIAAAWRRLWPDADPLDGAAGVFRLLAVAAVVCAGTAAGGAAVIVLGLGAADFAATWLGFGLSDLMGVVIVTPVVLAWHGAGGVGWQGRGRALEAAGLAAATAGLTLLTFAVPHDSGPYLLSFSFPVFPLGLWAALRFGRRGTTAVLLAVALAAVGYTGAGRGPFGAADVGTGARLLTVQAFLCVLTVSKVVLAAEFAARRRAESAKAATIAELQQALAEITELRGLIPMCAWCKHVRDDGGYWRRIEDYLATHTGARTTHGICPTCLDEQMAELESNARPA